MRIILLKTGAGPLFAGASSFDEGFRASSLAFVEKLK